MTAGGALDALLIEPVPGIGQRFLPDGSTAKYLLGLAAKPEATARQLRQYLAELGDIVAGESRVEPDPRDRRFADQAWRTNPLLRRILQAHLVTRETSMALIDLAELDWRDETRVRFLIGNLLDALAPSNVPLVNPVSARVALDYGGLSLVQGALNFVDDMKSAPRLPTMVDAEGFALGTTLAATPGAVVYRSEVFELLQYHPVTEKVHATPLLIVPPTINKYYITDLAPERSMVEYLVAAGQQPFVMSWRNPDAEHADWGLGTYVRAVFEAMDAVERITGADQVLLGGACSGGMLASCAAALLAHRGELDRLAGFSLMVTVLDNARAGEPAAFANRPVAEAAKAMSRRVGYLDGRYLAEGFAWLRPNDLIWSFWVNNYLCGGKPPKFDVLYWNSDVTRMPARLHADFIDVGMHNALARPGGLTIDGEPVDVSAIDTDSYVLAAISDHITPWQNCYRSVGLLGGDSRFVLSRSGHIAALVNPPGNPKSKYQVNPENPTDTEEWLAGAETYGGSWWPDWLAWLAERAGPMVPAPRGLGGGGLAPLAAAPGTYVHAR
ncbi:PHA/PHB synthase family protein [Nocardia sp. NPDC050406]|uniref:PHA/PHB synthase family protein n=1 Tax=Nocardia sp. NPDC050406 TaxID=3364318 RepID=UPI0037967961